MVNTSQPTLLERYDLQIEQLDYKFIGSCKNVKTLEKILKVLRSGQEGFYPDLTKYCENRLKELSPNNRFLNPATRILTYSDLQECERSELGHDLEQWEKQYDEKSEQISKDDINDQNIPPIRGRAVKVESTIQKEKSEGNKKCCKLRSYSEWEKFDVEKELKEEADEKTSKEKKTAYVKPQKLPKSIAISGLPEKERHYIANLEKNKGNEAFKARDYEEAILYYTRSLSAFKTTAALNNRAQAHIKTKNYLAAVQDCTEVISIEPENIKALYRRGIAYKEEEIYDLAKLDFKLILELEPENKLAKEQLKEIKSKKSRTSENKKVLIEELETNNEKEAQEGVKENNAVRSTRMTIEEVDNSEAITELTNVDSSSDEDDNVPKLPQKVKRMLTVTTHHKKQIGTSQLINKSNHGNISQCEAITEKPKIIECPGNSCKERNRDKEINMSNNSFVAIKIEEKTSNESDNSSFIDTSQRNADSHKSSTIFENQNLTKVNNTETTYSENEAIHIQDSETQKEINSGLNYIKQETLNGNTASNSVNAQNSDIPMRNELMYSTSDKENIREKFTPYEFHRMWLSTNATYDSKVGAEYLLQINPEELPGLITNKLDGSLLYGLLKAIYTIYKMGKYIEGEKYLKFLTEVPRIQIVSMLLSDTEMQEIQLLFANLKDDYKIHMAYVSKIMNN